MKKLLMYFMVISITLNAFAQSPQKMNYQAVIRNSSNGLVTSSPVGMRISILQGSATGTPVYIETQTSSTNANGLVTIEIGGGTPVTGTFAAIDWSAGSYFIKTETDPTGGINYTIIGTSQLLSMPYALHAKTAENGFSGNYIDLTNKPTLFDGNYNSLLNLPTLFNGQYSNLTGIPTFASVATSGNYNDLINKPTLFNGIWISLTGKPTTIAGYGIIDAMTTAHPANGITSINITNWNSAFSWGNHAGLYRPISYVPAWSEVTGKPTLATVATSGSYADLSNQPIIPTTTSQLTNNSGFLTSEVQALSISNDTIKLSNGGFVKLPKSAWSLLGNAGTIAGTNFIGTTDAKDFVIKTNNTEKMRVSSTGKVGIGINNGTFPLEVCVPSTSGSQMNLKLTNLTLGIGNGVGILFAPDDAAIAKMGIFVERRDSWGFSTMHFLSRTSPDYVSADLSNSVMAITSNGNVGIGTISPITKLQVNGIITATGGNSTSWNTAYSWGNHASAGYLTSFAETDPEVGSNISGYSPKWDGTALITGAIYQDASGNVGIGTTSPGAKLEVNGDIIAANRAYGMVYRSSAYDIPVENSWVDIPLNGGNANLVNVAHSTITNPERVTVNVSGTYLMQYTVHFRRQGAAHHGLARLYKNSASEIMGSFTIASPTSGDSNEDRSLIGHVITTLSANDYVTIQVSTNTNLTNEIDVYFGPDLPNPTTRIYSLLTITKIGP